MELKWLLWDIKEAIDFHNVANFERLLSSVKEPVNTLRLSEKYPIDVFISEHCSPYSYHAEDREMLDCFTRCGGHMSPDAFKELVGYVIGPGDVDFFRRMLDAVPINEIRILYTTLLLQRARIFFDKTYRNLAHTFWEMCRERLDIGEYTYLTMLFLVDHRGNPSLIPKER